MSYWTTKYSDVAPRLKDWLRVGDGGNVSDVALDLLNRAQDWLWQYKAWPYLAKTIQLTLTNNAVTLPSDFGRVIDVYDDSNGDGYPDKRYFENNWDITRRYTLTDSFATATGHSWVMTFNNPAAAPYLKYQKLLTAFAGTGTEYSFFPAQLIIRAAQIIHYDEKGIEGSDYSALKQSLEDELRDYQQATVQTNSARSVPLRDNVGQIVSVEHISLSGAGDAGYPTNALPRDYLP